MMTPDSIFANVATIAEAKAIVSDVRLTAVAVSAKYGDDHAISKEFWDRYYNYVDVMVFKYA